MQTTRTNFNTIIAKDVMAGRISKYSNTKNGIACWTLLRGKKALYAIQDTTSPINTLILHSPHKSTYLFLSCEADEIASYISNHEQSFAKTLANDARRAEYIETNGWTKND